MTIPLRQLFQRFGPVNGQVQTHREGNTAPCRRGIWAFPRVLHVQSDYYMIMRRHIAGNMPKRLVNWDFSVEGGHDSYTVEYDAWMKKMHDSRVFRWHTLTLDLDKEIYSHTIPSWDTSLKSLSGTQGIPPWSLCTVRELWNRIHSKPVVWDGEKLVNKIYHPCGHGSMSELDEVFIPM